jgi:hypothetical protein
MGKAIRDYSLTRGYSTKVVDGGLAYLLSDWERTVQSIASGEPQYLDDYLNDMDARRIIEELLPLATPEERAQYDQPLGVADKQFHAVTIPTGACIWGVENERQHGWERSREWWYYRRPQHVGPDWPDDRR